MKWHSCQQFSTLLYSRQLNMKLIYSNKGIEYDATFHRDAADDITSKVQGHFRGDPSLTWPRTGTYTWPWNTMGNVYSNVGYHVFTVYKQSRVSPKKHAQIYLLNLLNLTPSRVYLTRPWHLGYVDDIIVFVTYRSRSLYVPICCVLVRHTWLKMVSAATSATLTDLIFWNKYKNHVSVSIKYNHIGFTMNTVY